MSAQEHLDFLSEEDYLEGELVSEIKHEYFSGRVYAMSGGTVNHSAVASNFLGTMNGKLTGSKCRSFTGDLSVRVEQRGEISYFYPDASVVCVPVDGSAQFTGDPAVILEVLSPSTRRTDETLKLQGYLSLESLQVCLLAEADEAFVKVYRRAGDHFTVEIYEGHDAEIDLPEIEMKLPLADLYRDVEFAEKAASGDDA